MNKAVPGSSQAQDTMGRDGRFKETTPFPRRFFSLTLPTQGMRGDPEEAGLCGSPWPQHSPDVEVLDVDIFIWGRLPLTPQKQPFFSRCLCEEGGRGQWGEGNGVSGLT